MQPVGTVVAFGAGPGRAAALLDATALACEVLDGSDFRRIKQAEGGSLLFLLLDGAGDPSLAAAVKAIRILRQRGGGEAIVVPPALDANPGPHALARLQRAAVLSQTCVVQPVAASSWADAVRCFVEPLAIFGLVGVDPREIHALVRQPRVALLHGSVGEAVPEARDILLTCRLRPNASLREVDDAARTAAERAPRARLVVAGPEIADDGPRTLVASLL
jgi:hypothetical protein